VVLATRAIVLLGDLEIAWDVVGGAALWLFREQFPTAAFHKRVLEKAENVTRPMQPLRAAAVIHYTKKTKKIWDVLEANSQFRSTLAIHRIYSILGLFPELRIEPDYTLDARHAFRAATRHLIENERDLAFHGMVQHGPSFPLDPTSSWAPSWSGDPFAILSNSPYFAKRTFQASAEESLRLLYFPADATLKLRDLVVTKEVAASSPVIEIVATGKDNLLVKLFPLNQDFVKSTNGFRSYGNESIDTAMEKTLMTTMAPILKLEDGDSDGEDPLEYLHERIATSNPGST
jgi:hypothetical protein